MSILKTILFGLLLLTRLALGSEFQAFTLSTNHPPYGFTAGGLPGYYYDANHCKTGNFTLAGEPGEYVMEWSPDLFNWHTVYNEADATQHDRDNAINPPIVIHNQPVTTWFAAPNVAMGFWRLKRK